MAIRESTAGKMFRKAMAVPLSAVLAVGCAPSLAFAGNLAPGAAELPAAPAASESQATDPADAGVMRVLAATASYSTSPQALYLPVLLRAVGGIEEFEDSYQACGDIEWAPEYALFDMGDNGIPELLVRVSSIGGNSEVHVFTVENKEAKYLGSYSEGVGSSAGGTGGRLFVAGWNQGRSFVNEITFSNGALKARFVSSGQESNAYFAKAGASWIEFADAAKFIALKEQGKYEISKAKVSVEPGGTYTGAAKTPKVTVKFGNESLALGSDFSVSYRNNVNAGLATATVKGAGVFQGSKSANFAIGKANISGASVSVAAGGTYTGAAKVPAVQAKFGARSLAAKSDYKVTYRNNVNAGTATATLSGVGNFQGAKNVTFSISKASNSLAAKASSKTVKRTAVKSKAQVLKLVSITKKGQGAVKFKDVSSKSVSKRISVNASTGAITVKKGTPKGAYQVKVQVSAAGNGNFNAASKTVSSKVTVK